MADYTFEEYSFEQLFDTTAGAPQWAVQVLKGLDSQTLNRTKYVAKPLCMVGGLAAVEFGFDVAAIVLFGRISGDITSPYHSPVSRPRPLGRRPLQWGLLQIYWLALSDLPTPASRLPWLIWCPYAQESLSALPIALPILALFGDVCRLWTVLSDALLLRYDLYLNESEHLIVWNSSSAPFLLATSKLALLRQMTVIPELHIFPGVSPARRFPESFQF
ncbi:hypothetical protein B0H13DRAFT_1866736 [Mycena leptocephala]|nr:hypothetical protein B0H13DRAFT_1866736 [Mycena leptocephala]